MQRKCGLVIPYCRYCCFHDSFHIFILLSIMLQTGRELHLQIFWDFVKIWLGVFVCCFNDSQCSWKMWLFRKKVAKCDMSVILKIGKEYFSKPLKALISWKKKQYFLLIFSPIFSKSVPSCNKMFQRKKCEISYVFAL